MPDSCLDPQLPFMVHAGGRVTLKQGEPFRLPFFANRNGAGIRYAWTVRMRPAGSTAAIVSPSGGVVMSRHWQYAYVDGQVPSFTADVVGTYTLSVSAQLAFPDRAYPLATSSIADLTLVAEP